MNRRGDLFADRPQRQIESGHQHQRLQPRERVARTVRVDRGQTPVMTGVHRLKHVQRFAAAAFADHNPIRTHPQRVANQIADGDRPPPLDIRRTRLQPYQMLLMKLQLRGILDRDNPFPVRQKGAQHVEQRRLSRSGTSRDQDILAHRHADRQKTDDVRRDRSEPDQIGSGERFLRKFPDRHRRTGKSQRRNDRVDPRRASTIGELSSIRRPSGETIRSIAESTWLLSANEVSVR